MATTSGLSYQAARRHPRFSLRYPVSLKFQQGKSTGEVQAISRNVSIGGLLVEACAAIPESSSVTFTLTVDGRPSLRPIQLGGKGRVVRVQRPGEDGKFTIAVECSDPISEIGYLSHS